MIFTLTLSRNFRDQREREVGEDPAPPELLTLQVAESVSRKYGTAHSNLTYVRDGAVVYLRKFIFIFIIISIPEANNDHYLLYAA